MTESEHLEREYSPSSRVGGSADPFIVDYEQRSALARGMHRVVDVGGGTLLAPAGHMAGDGSGEGAPLLVYIHGGYWQALSAQASLYLAPRLLRQAWSYAAVEYRLAPAATIEQMIDDCTAALAHLARAVRPSLVVLAGHSAGAHLAAMAALVRRPPLEVDRVVLVSGVYDLRPLVHTTVNAPLGLDEQSAVALSPMLAPLRPSRPDTVVVWGDNDTDAFAQQSRAFAAHAGAHSFECAGRHHFDIVDDLTDPTTPLGAVTLALRTTAPEESARG